MVGAGVRGLRARGLRSEREGGKERAGAEAEAVDEHMLTGVQVRVVAQIRQLREAARTQLALERPVGRVHVLVVPQVARRRERLGTVRTLVRLLRAVSHPVVVEV